MAQEATARDVLSSLRRDIARVEGRLAETLVVRRHGAAAPDVLPLGAPRLDAALGGGLPAAGLVELHAAETRDAGAAAGFALALVALSRREAVGPLLWVATGEAFSEAGVPYAPGLAARFGVAPEALLTSAVRRLEDALWVAEEAAALGALRAVILEMREPASRLDLTATRRLHRRAGGGGLPLYLLRQAGRPVPTAAPVRLVVAPAPAGERAMAAGALEGSIGPPAFAVTVSRSRLAIPATATLEWNEHDHAFREREPARAAHPGTVAALSGDRAHPARQAGAVVAFRGVA